MSTAPAVAAYRAAYPTAEHARAARKAGGAVRAAERVAFYAMHAPSAAADRAAERRAEVGA